MWQTNSQTSAPPPQGPVLIEVVPDMSDNFILCFLDEAKVNIKK